MRNARNTTPRRLGRIAVHGAVRGFATAAGAAVVTLFTWWVQNR
ncbi:hypothetical protein ABZ626_19980 [Streptomyces longispororuber]